MGGIPLAALSVRPPEQQAGPLDQVGKALQLKQLVQAAPLQQQAMQQQVTAGGQENQIRAQQLADTQAQTAALKAWDGKDVHDLPGLLLKHGGSAQAVFGMKNQLITQQKNLAEADEATVKNEQSKNDMIAGHLEAVKSAPADQKPQAFDAAITDLEQKGLVKPGTIPHQYPGDDKLDLFEKTFQGGKQIVDAAMKERQVKAEEVTAQSRAQGASTSAEEFKAKLPGGPLNRVTQDIAVATNPQIQQGKINVARAEGEARAAVETAAARGDNPALANVAKPLVVPAAAAAEKANKEYADAKSVSDRMNATMDAARKGNVVSYQIIPEEGTLQITTSQGVHRINKTEIDQYAGGGSLWQRMQAHFGKALTGQSIPESVMKDMAEIQNIQAEGAQSRYENTLKSVNGTYGSNFKPVDMGGLKSVEGGGAKPAAAPQKPANATHIGVGSADKKKHYLDASGKDLGLAE